MGCRASGHPRKGREAGGHKTPARHHSPPPTAARSLGKRPGNTWIGKALTRPSHRYPKKRSDHGWSFVAMLFRLFNMSISGPKTFSAGRVLTCLPKGRPHVMGLNGPQAVVISFPVDVLEQDRDSRYQTAVRGPTRATPSTHCSFKRMKPP